MEKMALAAKAKQSQSRLDELMDKIWNKYSKGTGADGSRYEKVVAQLVSANGIKTELVAESGRVDLLVYLPDPSGKRKLYRIEIKTGTGIVAQLAPTFGDSMEQHSEDELLPKADLVIYTARATEFEDIDDLLDESLVLERKDWIQFMIENSGVRKHGFSTAFKLSVNNGTLREKNEAIAPRPVVDKKGNQVYDEDGNPKFTKRGLDRWTDCIVIQEAYQKQIAQAITDNLATNEYRTLGRWLEEIGRA